MSLQKLGRYEDFKYDKYIRGEYNDYRLTTRYGWNVDISPVSETEFIGKLSGKYLNPVSSTWSAEIRYSTNSSLPIDPSYSEECKILVDKWITKYATFSGFGPYSTTLFLYGSEELANLNSLPSDRYLLKIKLPFLCS